MLYLTILNETKSMVLQSRNLLKSQQYFLAAQGRHDPLDQEIKTPHSGVAHRTCRPHKRRNMDIAQNKRRENIAEYILYLWQLEDLLRALQFSPRRFTAS